MHEFSTPTSTLALYQLLAAAPDGPPQKIRGLVQDSVDVNWRPPTQPPLPGFSIKGGPPLPSRVKITSPAGMIDFEVTSPTTAYAYEGQGVVSKVESRSDGVTGTTDIQIDLMPEVVQADGLILRQIDGHPLWQRRSDGYWNATAMCNAAGKLMANYTRNAGTQEFMDELSRSMRIRIDLLTTVQVTGPNAERGTWVHPKVAYHLAQWLSPRFAVRVSGWIDELLTTGRVELRPEPDLATVPGLRRSLRDSATHLLAALEYQEELEAKLEVAEARADEHRAEAEALAKQKAREARAINLTTWLKNTWTFHGHGQNIGMKTLRALSVLRRVVPQPVNLSAMSARRG